MKLKSVFCLILILAVVLIGITGAYAQLAPGTKAPNFKLASSAGDTVSLEKLNGKIVIIHFWHVG